jgi:hypothetical protein
MDPGLKYALIVFAVIVGILLLTKIPGLRAKKAETISIAQFQNIAGDVKRLWSLAKQDRNLLLSVMHTTSALSKLSALQQLDSSRQLAKKLDLDFEGLRISIQKLQQDKLHEINTMCPGLALDHELDWSV